VTGTYLDWNATAPLRPSARAALVACLDEVGNPSSVHAFGRRARRRVEDARAQIAALVNGPPGGVIFTGSGTEADNLALRAVGVERILISATEHSAVRDAATGAEIVPVGLDGLVDPAVLDSMLASGTGRALVSVHLANNETGVIQPLADIARVVKAHGALLHTDAVQAAGRIPVDMAALGVDLLSLSAHKLGGPQGVGALVVGPGVPLFPLVRGGGQEKRQRAGTENVAGIAAFGAAAAEVLRDLGLWGAVQDLRDRLEARMLAAAPNAVVFGGGAPRLPNTLCVGLPGVPAETQLMAYDLAGIAVSSGAACSSGTVKVSHVLAAMGVPDDLARTAIRVSLGWTSTAADIDRFFAAWARQAERSRGRAAA